MAISKSAISTVFKTIRLGTGLNNADDFRRYFKDNKMRLSDWANDILGNPAFGVATKEIELDLVAVTVEELGFPKGVALKDVYASAKKCGLQLCPAEVGPQLRLQYKDQPKDEWLTVGMEPITASDGNPCMFHVGHDDRDLWLLTDYGYPDSIWLKDYRFVFVLPRE